MLLTPRVCSGGLSRTAFGTLTVWLSCLALYIANAAAEPYDPCCSYPCQNFGICNRNGLSDQYYCDCYGTGYYGDNCETATWSKWIYETIRPSPFTIQSLTTHGPLVWKVINNIKFIHSGVMRTILKIRAMFPAWPEAHNTAVDYTTWDGYANKSYWGRTLPAVPKNCPTPMGVAGPKVLPDVQDLVEKVFKRTEFKPCPRGTSVLLPLYGQHFTHQAFKSSYPDRSRTWGYHTIDLTHLYGETLTKQYDLRTFKDGKMKMQVINGEEYPPNEKDCPGIDMKYPPQVKKELRFCMGHPFFAMLPSLLFWSTLWLREHNRVCDVMAKEHPDWDDERLFQTARLIILGETMKVTIESYVQHISGMHFQLTYEPDLIHDSAQRWSSSRLHVEFNTLYHWHNTMPDYFLIGGKNYSIKETYYNMAPLVDHGMEVFTSSLSNQVAGRGAGGRNMPVTLRKVAVETIKMNREVRLQPFNRYREYFRLPPYKTFEDLTGETKLAKVLSDLYEGDIDGVEFFVGIMIEKRHPSKMWGITLIEAIGNYALRSVFSNTIASPQYWRESTFGGKVGFDLVKSTNVENLACRNIRNCPKLQFQVPGAVTENTDPGMVYNDLDDIAKNTDTSTTRTEL